MEKLVALCKRRGFIFQDSEIYGGINGFWDYGPLGVELKRNLKEAWWKDMVHAREDMVGLESTIIMHPQVWKASGHFDLFCDKMQTCRQCKKLFRADQVESETQESEWYRQLRDLWVPGDAPPVNALRRWAERKGARLAPGLALVRETDAVIAALSRVTSESRDPAEQRLFSNLVFGADGQRFLSDVCPNCGGDLTEPRDFNLMFESYTGALRNEDNKVFLRPETAQGIFVNFKNVVDTTRIRLPFGIAQIGKSFRNEITPRNYTFRSREFEQMEIEFFCHPDESPKWYEYWRDERLRWWVSLGLGTENLRLRDHDKEELSHYSCGTADIEYAFPFLPAGEYGELEGVAHRGDFDLKAHMEGNEKHKGSGKDLTYFDDSIADKDKRRFVPHVIEPSAGADRGMLALLCEAYRLDESRPSPELMCFHPRMAPIKAAVFPLVNKDGMPERAHRIYEQVRRHWPARYDAKQSIGRRYARMDEAGTPFCFTIDGQTLEDGTVTARDRDTGHQIRIGEDRVVEYLREHL